MSHASEPETTVLARADEPVTGYSVLMDGDREVSPRYRGEVRTRNCPEGIELTMTPGATIFVTEPTTHLSSVTDTGVEILRTALNARPGDWVTLQPWRREYERRTLPPGV